jgi:hypothetical protein
VVEYMYIYRQKELERLRAYKPPLDSGDMELHKGLPKVSLGMLTKFSLRGMTKLFDGIFVIAVTCRLCYNSLMHVCSKVDSSSQSVSKQITFQI